jgi:hypothetical protein
MKKLSLFLMILFSLLAISFAQPRQPQTTEPQKNIAKAPESFAAKYEGGLLGYSQKEKGKLKFDDENERFVFFGKDSKEKFSIPYESVIVVMPSSKTETSTTGKVVSNIPLYGLGLAGLALREKKRYLVIQYADPNADIRGITNFKIETKELLESVIYTLAEKAKLKQQGDAFYRPSVKTEVK